MRRSVVLFALALVAKGAAAQYIVTGAGTGTAHVKRFDGAGTENRSFLAYAGTPGVTVAQGDFNGDGVADIITGTAGSSTHVKVFDGATNAEIASFIAYSGFTQGVNLASGDVNGDGYDDIITAPRAGTPTHVKVFAGPSLAALHSFFAYDPSFTGGVTVGSADFDNDGLDDIICGAETGASVVKVYSGASGGLLASFFAYGLGYSGGVYVAGGDVDGDGDGDIITGTASSTSHVKVFTAPSLGELVSFFAYTPFHPGVRVAAGDVDGDHVPELITGTAGGTATASAFSMPDASLIQHYAPYGGASIGVFVAGYSAKPAAAITGSSGLCSDSATIDVALTGRAPWTLEWSDGAMSTNILSSPFQRTVSAAGTYTITRVQDLNHTHGPVSGVANVSAGSQLTITVQPADQTINAGQTAMTSVTATGATSYQWFFFGTDQAFHPIPGATSSTLAYAPAETTKVMVRVSNATCSVDSAVANIFVRPATPLNVGATATSTTAVAVAWSAVPNAVSYEILRSSGGGPFAVTGGAMGTTFGQSGLTAGVTYLYRVRAVDGYGTKSLDSAMDAATTIIFGEDPLVAGVTPIRAQHILELRTAANAFRAAAGLGSASFGAIVVGTTPIRASDINELRSAFAAARAALSMPALVLTDPTLVPGATVVRRLHVEELRAGVK